ncbi:MULTISPECIES: hypothetical protein [Haloferax]|uniref:DUF8070 domain-containing protein n=1 Tax=Haloferax massiliensis TaxID=1476858 RepID=A0A0D6JQ02_9EURY|nr:MULTISPECIES: hypothetical protein [Haloferax]MDS0239833.1 hypothetical protein [Haloferax sp. S2CR25]MDS0442954.1 hypothetical protein [Haloferax sp. S2CR25-2]CQR49929.1 hypothetical protein BN996_01405 [Haloferax massiliensis]
MNLDALWRPTLLYTGLLGLLTVGAVYLATHSGMYMLALLGAGVLLVVLGGGAVGQMGPSNVEHAGEKGGTNRVVSNAGLWSPVETDTSLRLALLFYGAGVFLWSLVVFGVLRDTLV